jgi:hypothetical protein
MLDVIKKSMVSGLLFRRDHERRKSRTPLPWITERRDLQYLRHVIKDIVAVAGIRTELSFASFRHGGVAEGANGDLTDAELGAADRHRSARQLPTSAKRTRKIADLGDQVASSRGANKSNRFVGNSR